MGMAYFLFVWDIALTDTILWLVSNKTNKETSKKKKKEKKETEMLR